ncbi:MAG: radical SAM protein [Deltaproteobacteria bacterium]|nr:radical SAM protein [Deltaproteobacteria bacterium]
MKIALYDMDNTKFPNLALMKISSFHKSKGDDVVWYEHLFSEDYEKVYCSKVFSFSNSDEAFGNIEKGGTGFSLTKVLPDQIEHISPDYSLYDLDYSLGFTTRGCPNQCSFCIVPEKEGSIKEHASIDEFLKHDKVVLMDNNILASDHGIKELEKLSNLNVKVDINQGLDARLIDNSIAKLLSKINWLNPLRMACDSQNQIKHIQKATTLLRWNNVTPRRYFVYCLIRDIEESLERIKFLKGMDLDVFAQPYRDFKNNKEPTYNQKNIARWVNHKAIFKTTTFEEYTA